MRFVSLLVVSEKGKAFVRSFVRSFERDGEGWGARE